MPEAEQKSNQVKRVLKPRDFDKWGLDNILDWFITVWLLLIIGITTWQLGGVHSETMIYNAYFMGALIIAHSLWFILSEESLLRFNPWALIFIPFLFFIFFSWAFWTPTRWIAKKELFLYLQGAIIFWVMLHNVRTREHLKCFIGGLLVIAMGAVFCAFYQFFKNPTWLPMGYVLPGYNGRATGTFGTPNNFAGLMTLSFFPLIVGAIVPRFSPLLRVFCGIGAFFFGCGLIFSMSRGGLLSVVIGLSLLPYGLTRSQRWRKAGWIILAAGVLFGGFFLYHHMDLMRYRADLMIATQGGIQSRFAMWGAAWNIFLENPILGSGSGSYNLFFEQYRPVGFNTDPIWAHNDYLNMLSDYGLIGFTLFFGAIFMILRQGYLRWKELPFQAKYSDGGEGMPKTKVILVGFGVALISLGVHAWSDFHLKIPALVFYCAAYLAIILKVCTHRTWTFRTGALFYSLLLFFPALGFCMVFISWAIPTYEADSMLVQGKRRMNKTFNHEIYRNKESYNKETFKVLSRASEIDPDNADAWAQQSYMAYFLAYEGLDGAMKWVDQAQRAQRYARKSLDLCNQQWFPNVCLGLGYLLENKTEEARPYFEAAVKLAPNNAQAWYYYGAYLALDRSRPDRALDAVNRSLLLDNMNHEAYLLQEKLEKIASM
tara:strand:+ start:55041 stop:57011 length:1971 start_codon:yes stop_codon:yes gene_type:complete